MTSATRTTPTIDHVLSIFETTLGQVRKTVADIPDLRLAEQPGTLVNHPAWTLSHLSTAAAGICGLLDRPVAGAPPDESKRFGPGSTPSPDRAQYAPKAALLDQLAERHALAVAAVRAGHADYFDRPTPENLRRFGPTVGGIAMFLLTAHESYHIGQLMQWRRAAGIKSP